jgi:hypothetical protein
MTFFRWVRSLNRSQTLSTDDAFVTALECAAELERWVRNLDVLLAECDAAAQQNDDHPHGEEWVGSYYLKCGPWHRVLGARQQVAWALQRWSEAASAAAVVSGTEEETE